MNFELFLSIPLSFWQTMGLLAACAHQLFGQNLALGFNKATASPLLVYLFPSLKHSSYRWATALPWKGVHGSKMGDAMGVAANFFRCTQ
ncbi:hypothetical protein F4801DRAFT_533448 [Xylaria longipes]|nr:hypothetical protein F4801DRAFT_533448 [Xylaria longipes]